LEKNVANNLFFRLGKEIGKYPVRIDDIFPASRHNSAFRIPLKTFCFVLKMQAI